jgi:hypothetical protein
MGIDNLSHPSSNRPTGRPRLTLCDRFLSWLVTGPLGRGLAFVLDLAALAWRIVRRRDRGPGVR